MLVDLVSAALNITKPVQFPCHERVVMNYASFPPGRAWYPDCV